MLSQAFWLQSSINFQLKQLKQNEIAAMNFCIIQEELKDKQLKSCMCMYVKANTTWVLYGNEVRGKVKSSLA